LTRHIDAAEHEGVSFVTSLDEESIEIRRASLPVGTTIRVRIAHSVSKTMDEWFGANLKNPGMMYPRSLEARDDYCLDDPRVERTVQPGNTKLTQPYALPSPGCHFPSWAAIQHPDYQEIHWSYSKAPHLSCNGILVAKEGGRYTVTSGKRGGKSGRTSLSIPPMCPYLMPMAIFRSHCSELASHARLARFPKYYSMT
jgi:hypothetical protein